MTYPELHASAISGDQMDRMIFAMELQDEVQGRELQATKYREAITPLNTSVRYAMPLGWNGQVWGNFFNTLGALWSEHRAAKARAKLTALLFEADFYNEFEQLTR